MKTFECLRELLDYIPKCIICQKDMELRIDGSVPSHKKPDYFNNQKVFLKMFMLEGNLHSRRCKDFSLTVNPLDNSISSGKELLNRMVSRAYDGINVIKKCRTCDFKIYAHYSNGSTLPIKKLDKFPTLTLKYEELNYTMRREKSVQITKSYQDQSFVRNYSDSVYVVVNNRRLKEFNLDLSKIQDLDHLNNKIKTVMVFQ